MMEVNATLYNAFITPVMTISDVITEEERVEMLLRVRSSTYGDHGALDGNAKSTHHTLRDINNLIGDKVVTILEEHANYFASTLGIPPVVLYNTWANIQNEGSSLRYHTHPNSEVSGVLYLNVNDSAAAISFINPNPYIKYQFYNKETEYNFKSFWVKPKNGDLVLFPSWLEHGSFNNTMKGRCCISFNAILRASAETIEELSH